MKNIEFHPILEKYFVVDNIVRCSFCNKELFYHEKNDYVLFNSDHEDHKILLIRNLKHEPLNVVDIYYYENYNKYCISMNYSFNLFTISLDDKNSIEIDFDQTNFLNFSDLEAFKMQIKSMLLFN